MAPAQVRRGVVVVVKVEEVEEELLEELLVIEGKVLGKRGEPPGGWRRAVRWCQPERDRCPKWRSKHVLHPR